MYRTSECLRTIILQRLTTAQVRHVAREAISLSLWGSVGFDESLNAILDPRIPEEHLNAPGIINIQSTTLGKENHKIPAHVSFHNTTDGQDISVNIQPEGWVQLDGNIEEESEIKLWEASEKLLKDWRNDD